MKIYNEIVFDVDGNVIYEDSFEYEGDINLLRGGKGKSKGGKGGGGNIIATDGEVTEEGGDYNRELGTSDFQFGANLTLPSDPILAVGSASQSFSGSINTQLVSGGFQPLPPVAGASKKLYQLSQFHGGVNKKSSPRDISDIECQTATNVTFSQIGRIKLSGTVMHENNVGKAMGTITTPNLAGYGLFEFGAPANVAETIKNVSLILTADGDQVDAKLGGIASGLDAAFLDFGGTDDDATVAQVYYASNNGIYLADANFANTTNDRMANIFVYRKDYLSASPDPVLTTKGWNLGDALISPPNLDDDTGAAPTGVDGRVNVEFIDSATTAFTATTVPGNVTVHIRSSLTGTWDGNYFFYISWLFDGGVETGLSALQIDGSSGRTFAEEQLSFNFSVEDQNDARNHPEGDARIEGARIYFKKSGDTERFTLAEISLVDGCRGALDSAFIPWTESAEDRFIGAADIFFENPPEVKTYLSENGYYADEVYGVQPDTLPNGGSASAAHPLDYKTAVVGQQGIVFIGNVKFDGKDMPDAMMFSMAGKPAVFPRLNVFPSPSSDSGPITALAAFQDKILQFKTNGMYSINVSNPEQFYAEASFRDCGVSNPCQVFTTSFGVIFVNKHGCFIYDGQKVISLTAGKFDWPAQSGISESSSIDVGDSAKVPSIGYDPRSQSIVILNNISNDSTDEGGWIYNVPTQSWTESDPLITTNQDGDVMTNFIITSEGYLTLKRSDDANLQNYNHDSETDTNSTAAAQTITYHTKDIDFGMPSQTKKIFKVYITYRGDCDNLTVKYRTDGTSGYLQFNSTNTPLTDTESLTLATLTPSTASEATGITSLSIYMNGSIGVDAASSFEINDISILYRARPIK